MRRTGSVSSNGTPRNRLVRALPYPVQHASQEDEVEVNGPEFLHRLYPHSARLTPSGFDVGANGGHVLRGVLHCDVHEGGDVDRQGGVRRPVKGWTRTTLNPSARRQVSRRP